jgi:hypothetical protein
MFAYITQEEPASRLLHGSRMWVSAIIGTCPPESSMEKRAAQRTDRAELPDSARLSAIAAAEFTNHQ